MYYICSADRCKNSPHQLHCFGPERPTRSTGFACGMDQSMDSPPQRDATANHNRAAPPLQLRFADHVLPKTSMQVPELFTKRQLLVARNGTMLLDKFSEGSVAQIRPAACINQFATLPASCPLSHCRTLGEDCTPVPFKISATVEFKNRRRATEVAVVPATWYDARSKRHASLGANV
jgi:hypothetical protein